MAGSIVLKPYERRREPGLVSRTVAGIGLVFLAAFYGLMCSIIPFQLVAVPAVPLLLAAALCLWLLPDTEAMYDGTMARLLLLFFGFTICWPNYIAVNLPGLPWMTPARALVISLVAVTLFSLATSSRMRAAFSENMNAVPIIRIAFWAFWAATTVSLFLSGTVGSLVGKYFSNQMFWTMMFGTAAVVAAQPGFVMRFAKVLAGGAIFTAMLAIMEFALKEVIWLSWLPTFLIADPEAVANIADGEIRYGTTFYRVRGPFAVSLYFAEFLALTMPFVLYLAFLSKSWRDRLLLGAGFVAVGIAAFLTGARSGLIALLLTLAVSLFMVSLRIWLRRPSALVSATVVYGYPAFALTMAGIILSWNRLRVMVLGGGQHASSNDAREQQWVMGWPKILENPLGHGVSTSGDVLQFMTPSGLLTVDSYVLTLLLDYGIIGCLAFAVMFLSVILFGGLAYLRSNTDEEQLLGPVTVAFLNFAIIKTVLSTEANLPLSFAMLGCAVALIRRQQLALDPDAKPGTMRGLLATFAIRREAAR